jgi:hypothetical protein
VLGRRAARRNNHKLLGMQLPNKIDLTGVGRQIGEAGRQFGRFAEEIKALREKAESIGEALG